MQRLRKQHRSALQRVEIYATYSSIYTEPIQILGGEYHSDYRTVCLFFWDVNPEDIQGRFSIWILALRLGWSPGLTWFYRLVPRSGTLQEHPRSWCARSIRTYCQDPQCVCALMHWINSTRCDTTPEANSCNQHFSLKEDITQGGHPSKYWLSRCCCTSVLK
jgi:hypothetical protein